LAASMDIRCGKTLLRKLSPGSGGRKILVNIIWLVVDKALTLSLGLALFVMLARHLGRADFGLLNYAMSFASLFSFIAFMGLTNIMVREIVRSPDDRDEILGSGFALMVGGGLAAMGLAIGAIMLVRPDDQQALWLVGIVAAGLVFKSFNVIADWFKSEVASRHTVIARNVALLLTVVATGVLVMRGAPVKAFAWVYLGQAALFALGLVVAYRNKNGSLATWRTRAARMISLLKSSWPLMFSALAVSVYMKIDQVMLGEMVGEESVGIYAAAVRLTEAWYFIPMAVCASIFPAILRTRERNRALYYRRLQRLYDILTWCALVVATAMTCTGACTSCVECGFYISGRRFLAVDIG